MTVARCLSLAFLVCFLVPLATHAAWWLSRTDGGDWYRADWSSAALLPPARAEGEAVIHILAARVGRWRGVFAHHSWIVVKEQGASSYTRFDVVGWGSPVRINHRDADGRWYGNAPQFVYTLKGTEAARLIPKIRAAVASYAYSQPGTYRAWPGPNSNSFVEHVLASVPEMQQALLPTALGKDYRDSGLFAGLTPSRTGLQLSLYGLAGLSVGWVEGIEVNLLGLVAGIDVRRPALKLPGWGRIGLASHPDTSQPSLAT